MKWNWEWRQQDGGRGTSSTHASLRNSIWTTADENTCMGAWEYTWEVPAPQWSKKSENKCSKEARGTVTLYLCCPFPRQPSSGPRDTHFVVISPMGESESKVHPASSTLWNIAYEAHFCLTPPRTPKGLAWLRKLRTPRSRGKGRVPPHPTDLNRREIYEPAWRFHQDPDYEPLRTPHLQSPLSEPMHTPSILRVPPHPHDQQPALPYRLSRREPPQTVHGSLQGPSWTYHKQHTNISSWLNLTGLRDGTESWALRGTVLVKIIKRFLTPGLALQIERRTESWISPPKKEWEDWGRCTIRKGLRGTRISSQADWGRFVPAAACQ